jgi:ethanolamine transporter EutH
MENELISQITSAAIVVYLLQAVKRSHLIPWLTMETATLNHLIAVCAAAVSAIGIHFAYSAEEGTLVVTGLTLSGLLHSGWHVLNQYAMQRITYDAVVKPGA